MWKSAIWDCPDECCAILSSPRPCCRAWYDKVAAEPWFVALLDMIRWTGAWAGTEEELAQELGMRVDREVRDSEDFPDCYAKLREYCRLCSGAFFDAELNVMHRDEFDREELQDFDVPGFGPDRPIIIFRMDAGLKPRYGPAWARLHRHNDPLLLALLIATQNGKRRGWTDGRRWGGDTTKLIKLLKTNYPEPGMNCSVWGAPGSTPSRPIKKDPLYYYREENDPHGYHSLLNALDPADYRRLAIHLRNRATVLREEGIKLTSESIRAVHPKRGKIRKTLWQLEAPPWRRDLPSRPFSPTL